MITVTWTRTDIADLIAEARTYKGVRFRHQGRSRSGIDCVGLLAECAKKKGLHFELPSDYTMHVDPHRLLNELKRRLVEISVKRVIIGDMLVIRFNGRSTHLALRTDKGILHSSSMHKKVVEHGYTEEWERRTIAAFRLPGRRIDE